MDTDPILRNEVANESDSDESAVNFIVPGDDVGSIVVRPVIGSIRPAGLIVGSGRSNNYAAENVQYTDVLGDAFLIYHILISDVYI